MKLLYCFYLGCFASFLQKYNSSQNFKGTILIIDEASMLILPQAAYAASLSKEKVVFAGDFMQLPPIYNTDNKHPSYDVVEKWLGHVFDHVNIEKRINNKEKNIS